jgi:hypothetical protein
MIWRVQQGGRVESVYVRVCTQVDVTWTNNEVNKLTNEYVREQEKAIKCASTSRVYLRIEMVVSMQDI